MRASLITAALFVLALPVASAIAQTNESLRLLVEGDVKHYKGMVATYRAGSDDVVSGLLTWDDARLAQTIAALDSLWDPTRPWSDDFLRSGALLQTAAGLRCVDEGDLRRAFFYLDLAGRHLRLGSPQLTPFASRWYYAVARLFRSRGEVPPAERVLEMGRDHLPADPLILYDSGTLEELHATGWYSAPLVSARSARDTRPLDRVVAMRSEHLVKAHDSLRRSVAGAPDPLARLHFGRVLMMQQSDREALEILTSVGHDTSDRATKYLALLFIGGLHERAGRAAEATAAYRAAVDCFPEAQAAYIALSEILQTSGQGDEARAILQELLKPGVQRREPWAWYFLEPRSLARERIQALFEEGRR